MAVEHTLETRDSAGNTVVSIGPQNVDAAGDLVKNLGVHNKAQQLLQRHARAYPVALVNALSRPTDGERTAFLYENQDLFEEVAKAARQVKGRRRFLADEDTVESVNVLGTNAEDRVLAILYRKAESGRSARGVISYSAIPAIERAFARSRDTVEVPRGARETLEGGSGDPADVDARLEEERRAAEARENELLAELADLREQVEGGQAPFPGYEDRNAGDIASEVREGGVSRFGQDGLDRIEAYEGQRKGGPRKTVLEAVEGARADADAPSDE